MPLLFMRGIDRGRQSTYGVEAIVRDNSGNWLVLVEEKPFDGGDFGPDAS